MTNFRCYSKYLCRESIKYPVANQYPDYASNKDCQGNCEGYYILEEKCLDGCDSYGNETYKMKYRDVYEGKICDIVKYVIEETEYVFEEPYCYSGAKLVQLKKFIPKTITRRKANKD